MKQKTTKFDVQKGFTLIELIVVIAILAVMSTILIIDFGKQRVQRNISIAKNETITNIRKVQAYILSSRNIDVDRPAKFYVLRMVAGDSSYRIQAVDNDYQTVNTVETVNLPSDMQFYEFRIDGTATPFTCLQIIFSAPYGKMYARGSSGTACRIDLLVPLLEDPVELSRLNERETTIYFSNSEGPITSSILLTPITGLVTPQ